MLVSLPESEELVITPCPASAVGFTVPEVLVVVTLCQGAPPTEAMGDVPALLSLPVIVAWSLLCVGNEHCITVALLLTKASGVFSWFVLPWSP